MPKPQPKPKPRKKAPGPSFNLRVILRRLGWTDKVIDRLTSKRADQIINDGRRMMPVDEVNILGSKK